MKTGVQACRRTGVRTCATALALVAMLSTTAQAQTDVRARMEARGLPAELVQQVASIAADATAQGLPTDPLADKAIEGYAKQVPAARIVSVVREFGSRMLEARSAVNDAGVAAPQGELITAAAEALGRGLEASQVGRVVRAAPQSELATSGLTVAAALTAQGMTTPRAVDVVTYAIRHGRTAAQILDLPSTARAMQQRGFTAEQAGEQILRGAGGPGGPLRPDGGRDGRPGTGRLPDGRPGSGAGPPPQRPLRPGEDRPRGDRPARP